MSALLADDPSDTPAAAPAAADPASTPAAGDAAAVAAPAEKTWLDTLPEDLRSNPSLQRYKEGGPEVLAKSYLNLERMIGFDKVPLPKDANDNEAWNHVYKSLGRPDDPGGYQFAKPEKLPEGMTYDDNMETWWRQAAHKSGLSARQAAALHGEYLKNFEGNMQLSAKIAGEEAIKCKTELRRDWGAEYELRRGMVNREFSTLAPTLQEKISKSNLARDPEFLKYIADVAARTKGETEAKLGAPGGGAQTPEAVKASIAKHRQEYSSALMDRMHPDHELRVRELNKMYETLFPNGEAA